MVLLITTIFLTKLERSSPILFRRSRIGSQGVSGRRGESDQQRGHITRKANLVALPASVKEDRFEMLDGTPARRHWERESRRKTCGMSFSPASWSYLFSWFSGQPFFRIFFIAASVCLLTWCSIPSLSMAAVCSLTPNFRKNDFTIS